MVTTSAVILTRTSRPNNPVHSTNELTDARITPRILFMSTVTILHTNDLHAHFEAMTRLATLIQHERAQAHSEGRPLLLLDAGDSASANSWESNVTQGRANYILLEAMGYDAAVIGNTDSQWGSTALTRLLTTVHFPLLAANLRAADPSLKTSEVFKTSEVLTGIIGLTTHEETHADFRFDDPIATARALIPQLRK